MTASILGSSAVIDAAVRAACVEQAPGLRADAASRPSADRTVHAARAVIRQAVARGIQHADAEQLKRRDVPRHRAIEIETALAEALGYSLGGDSRVVHADSAHFAESRVARAQRLIAPAEQPEMARVTVPVESIPAWADTYDVDTVDGAGKADFIGPNTTNFPHADIKVGRKRGSAEWIGITYTTRWADAVYSQAPDAIDEMARLARESRRAVERLWETTVLEGGPGLTGLTQLAINTQLSTVDFSTATLGEMAEELIRMLQAGRQDAGDRGVPPSVGLVDPRLARLWRSQNNIDAGGDAIGGDVVRRALSGEGVQSVVECPTMPASSRGPGYAQAILWSPAMDGSIKQYLGMPPAPVSVSTAGHGTETLIAAKIGGCQCPDGNAAIKLDIKVA